MPPIPFALSSAPGRNSYEGAGRLINCYAEPRGEELGPIWRRSPGLTAFGTANLTVNRGMVLVGGTLYSIIGTEAFTGTSAGGAQTSIGNVSGSRKVFWARNNRTPTPDLVLVDPDNGGSIVTPSSVSSWTTPAVFNSVTFQDGYFFGTTGDGRAFASDLNDTVFDSNNYVTAEAKPDGLVRAVAWSGQLLLFGPNTCEVYVNTANPTGFPFTRSVVIPRGLLAPSAIAGQADGFGYALLWVADDNTVVKLNGYQPDKVSPPDLDRLIGQVTDKTTLEACVYVADGHLKWVLSSPTWTWEFDLNTEKWNERRSYGVARWRASQSVNAFGKWIVGDSVTGDLMYVDPAAYVENGNPLALIIESQPVQDFPSWHRVARADFNFITGVGQATGIDPTQTDPSVAISWSDDGGVNWSVPLHRALGRQSKPTLVSVTQTGLSKAQGRRWRLEVSDAVYAALLGGAQSAVLRRAA